MCFETFLIIKISFPLSFCNRRRKNLLGAVTTHVCETIQLYIKKLI